MTHPSSPRSPRAAQSARTVWAGAALAGTFFVLAWFSGPLRRAVELFSRRGPDDAGLLLLGAAILLALVGRGMFRRGP